MKAIGIIPARYGSTRFPGKALADICGKPMVVRVYERARLARTLARVVVATDDGRILDAVKDCGGEAVMTSAAHQNGTDRLAEAARALDGDLIVNIQGDEPLLDPDAVDLLVRAMGENSDVAMGTLAAPAADADEIEKNSVVKVVTDQLGFALYFSRAVIPYPRQPEFQRSLVHIGIYAYTRAFLLAYPELPVGPLERCESLEQLRALENGRRILVCVCASRHLGLSVDVPGDLDAVCTAFAREYGEPPYRAGPARGA